MVPSRRPLSVHACHCLLRRVRLAPWTPPLWQRVLPLLIVLVLLAGTGRAAWSRTDTDSAAAAPAPVPVALDIAALQVPSYWLRPHARVLREPPGATALDPMTLLHRSDLPWQPVQDTDPVFNFGTDRAAWWVHVPLAHRGDSPTTLWLEVTEPLIDFVDIWLIERGSARTLTELHSGDRRPFGTRPIEHRHPLLPLTLAPGQAADLLVRVSTVDGEHDPLPLRLWEPAAFEAHARSEALLYGAYYGALTVLLLYNALLALGTRERAFAWYTLFLGSFLVWNLTYRGFALQYLWPNAPTWNQIALVGFSALIYATMAAFAWSLLELPRRSPWAFRAQALLAAAALGHAVWIAVDPTAATFATLDTVGLAMFAALIAGALHVAWQGERLAWWYLAALGSLFTGAGIYYLTKLEVITPGPLSLQALNLGSVGEFLLLALALAHRINRLKTERDDAQRALIAALRDSEHRLEQQVNERTRELAEANAQLTALAERDALTGLYNRRRFDAQLPQELARAQRSGRPLGLLVLDIDHFKDVNDLAGHTQGDVTLARLGRLIEHTLQ
ncbi:putative diguanylate cyclase AdrA [Tepidimonas charontis]|uniref:diguanylate cyclase n=1 Tax=Tepidimonas charontis TaxID=2267262 RepID=A0A554X5Y5_9BURK|nr:putative diguanylate cyclase AdrA [Tepidimonas charontis]